MSDAAKGGSAWRDFGAALARPVAADLSRWQYMPAAPRLRRRPDGGQDVTMIAAADILMLTATTEFGLDQDQVQRLAQAIVAQASLKGEDGRPRDPASLTLEPVPSALSKARLVLVDGSAEREIASATPAGYGLQTAAFGATLLAADAEALKAALEGEGGRLSVVYDGARVDQRRAEATLRADAAALAATGSSPLDPAAAERLIDDALESGVAAFAESADPEASDELKAAVREEARGAAVAGLVRLAAGPPATEGGLDASASRTETVSVPFSSRADIRLDDKHA